ncbi:MAG: hypothetical protein HY530_04945 [Chloroflexi bacterium]|nr:hypothetical protein [Chloroflexota bacterium]
MAQIKPDNGNLLLLYQHSWKRLQHVDRQRMFFSNLYATIVTGLFAFLTINNWNWYGLLFVFILSAFAFLLNHRINEHVTHYENMMKKIAEDIGCGDYYTPGASSKAKITLRRLYKYLPIVVFVAFLIITISHYLTN